MRSSRFRVLQWLYSAVSHSYICENRRVRFLPVKVYERYVEDRLLSVCSKQRNENFFARLNVVGFFFQLIFPLNC